MKLKSLLVSVLMISNLWGSAIEPRPTQHKIAPSGYVINGRAIGMDEAKFFDLDENGSLSSYEKEVASIWDESNSEVQPEPPFKRSWLHTYFDMNMDGKLDKFEKEFMVKVLFRWDNIKKGISK